MGPSRLKGRITPPPSKSMAHRLLIAAALAGVPFPMTGCVGQDVAATEACLQALEAPGSEPVLLDCGESGSTLRFLLPVAAALGRSALFVGSPGLARRPLREYGGILEGKGVRLEFLGPANLPVRVEGRLRGGVFAVPGHISSQYITGLLMALPLVQEDSTIELTTPLQSAPYVELTLGVLDEFGIEVETLPGRGWRVPGGQGYRAPSRPLALEADYSQAAFWLVAKFLGHDLEVEQLPDPSLQGDRVVVSLLDEMAHWPPGEERRLTAAQIPDLVPALAVAACARPGVTVIEQVQRLRWKESDRVRSISTMLRNLGARVFDSGDALIIEGGEQFTGGTVHSFGDHRIVMAAAVAALSSKHGATIVGSEAVAKSYPHFFQELQRLGGDVRGI